jgi:uncharacterized membrane protein AbrB (regulator of aidB expression)
VAGIVFLLVCHLRFPAGILCAAMMIGAKYLVRAIVDAKDTSASSCA